MAFCRTIRVSLFNETQKCIKLTSSWVRSMHDLPSSCVETSEKFKQLNCQVSGIRIWEEFVTPDEELAMMKEIDRKWRRLKYQPGHWDNAIQNYREIELSNWSNASNSVIENVRNRAFKTEDKLKSLTHVLDLHEDGVITAHVDSTRFCGRALASLCLQSPCVMKYTKVSDQDVWFKVLLNQRSLYVMEDDARYNYSHEVLPNDSSYFNGQYVHKSRRVSVITRTEPDQTSTDSDPTSLFKSTVVSLD